MKKSLSQKSFSLIIIWVLFCLLINSCTGPKSTGEMSKKKQTIKKTLPGLPDPDALETTSAISKIIPPNAKTDRFLKDSSFVMKWDFFGPFSYGSKEFKNPKDAIHHEFMMQEKYLNGSQKSPADVKWHSAIFQGGKIPGRIDLEKLYGKADNVAAYAVAILVSPVPLKNLKLQVGSSDFIKIWINSKLVHTYSKAPREGKWDQDIIEGIQLRKGRNRIVVKCVDVTGEWDFFFRLTDKDGTPVCIKP